MAPSLDPHVRTLAVAVEDHPVEYGTFEGIIPQGQYGGGTVMLWDRGTWEAEGNAASQYAKGKLRFQLHGEKLRGEWTLVRMRGATSNGGKNWLLIKRKDSAARPPKLADITASHPNSVATGRTMAEIAAAADAVWHSHKAQTTPDWKVERLSGAVKQTQPKSLPPQLATAADAPPDGDEWLHELKLDGYRIIARLRDGKVRLFTRNENDWTDRFPAIAAALSTLDISSAIFDGEVVALSPDGNTDFQELQSALRIESSDRLVYFLFDLPYCDGFDLCGTPLVERKELLSRLLKSVDRNSRLRFNDHIAGTGAEILRHACELRVEGIVSKRAARGYRSGRSGDWLKVKCRARQEFVIGGFSQASGTREHFGALLLGYYNAEHQLVYCGRVGTGFNRTLLGAIGNELEHRRQPSSPFADLKRQRGVRWVAPGLVADVEFAGWTTDGILRHAAFKGLREDKDPRAVTREIPVRHNGLSDDQQTSKRARQSPAKSNSSSAIVAGVRLSNPQRVLYPEQRITKLDLARYYESISEWVLPQLVDRPLSLVRCPQGRQAKCFYQRHHNEGTPDAVDSVEIDDDGQTQSFLYIRNLKGLISLVQLGVLEFHPWGARVDQVDRPDQIVLDFDPAEDVPWERVIEAAIRMRDLLSDVGLTSFVRTTGGKGLHVVAPIARRSTWDDIKQLARDAAERMVQEWPREYIATASKQARHGKIYIDYLRNSRSATAIGSYSTRARPGAPVATPLTWQEITADVTPAEFHVLTIPQRLAKLRRDPWEGFVTIRPIVTKAVRRRLSRR